MSKIYQSLTELIGGTPLLQLNAFGKDLGGNIIAKIEAFNPGGSSKDRVGKSLIEDAEKKGLIKEGSTIIEPTSGNTGVGLAAVATAKGYRAILTMPETMSVERRNLLKAFGAEIVLTDGTKAMTGAIEKAEELAKELDGYIPGQFVNEANPQAHYDTTGPEIWEDTDGKVDVFVATVGTGGTLTGAGKFLKEKNPEIKVIGVEPAGSPVLSGGEPGPHGLQGIGAGFVPEVLDTELMDEVIAVTDEAAFEASRNFAALEGILVGISSGAALVAAADIAGRDEFEGKNIVVLLPDTGERYLSTDLFK